MTLMKVKDISPCISDLPAHKPLPFLPCTSSSPPFTLFTPGSSGFEEWPSSGFLLKQNSFHVLSFSLFPEFILMKYIFIHAFTSKVLDHVLGRFLSVDSIVCVRLCCEIIFFFFCGWHQSWFYMYVGNMCMLCCHESSHRFIVCV